MTGLIPLMLGGIDVLGHLVLDRLLQCTAGALAGDLFDGGKHDRLGCKPEGNIR